MGCVPSKEAEIVPEDCVPTTRKFEDDVDSVEHADYEEVDTHARNAPDALRNSVPKLVAYLSEVSSEPRMIARAIFVWISENIAYDIDSAYGGGDINAPSDAESVMRGGSSVCDGYANVISALYREAGIPVRKISGFAKGYGYSAEKQFSTARDVDHAWNAVRLGGKWFLVDSTWGAGHTDDQHTYKKEFNEFYFLTDPEQFAYSHFPYMNNDMGASSKWQLLKLPFSLKEFNKNVDIKSEAFKLGVMPVSHKHGLIKMKNEVTLTFKCDGKDEVAYSTCLLHRKGKKLNEKPHNIFDQNENGLFTTRIHPHKKGTFELTVFGRKAREDGNTFAELFQYIIKCKKVKDSYFTFPKTYSQAQIDHCILVAPTRGTLKQNSEVEIHITSPYLSRVMVKAMKKTNLKRNETSFKGTVQTGSKATLTVYGSRNSEGNLDGLYEFQVA